MAGVLLSTQSTKGIQVKAQWLCDLPGRDASDLGLREAAQVLFTPSFLKKRPLTAAEFSEVHEAVAKGLAALRAGKRWSYKIVSAETFLEPVRSGGIGSGGGAREGWVREQKETFVVEAMRILALAGDRLRVCGGSDCDRLICAVKRQEFCRDCAKAARKKSVADWREQHPEEVRKWAKAHYQRRKKRQAVTARKRAR